MNTPLVSFFLMVYNQAPFLRKSILSAFAQDYPNLEIIISDDASTDGSQEIIRELTKDYKGPHTLKVNLNKENQFFGHMAQIMGMCDGEFIVQGHGDDMFFVDRTTKMVKAWQETGATVVTCNALVVDAQDTVHKHAWDPNAHYNPTLKSFVLKGECVTGFGACMAWDKKLWNTWGPLPPGPRQMDLIFAWRGHLMTGAHFIKEPLVFYRQHGDNMSMWSMRQKAKSDIERRWVEERAKCNKTANILAMLDDATAHLQSHPKDLRVQSILEPLSLQFLSATRTWTHFRHDMASERIGVV